MPVFWTLRFLSFFSSKSSTLCGILPISVHFFVLTDEFAVYDPIKTHNDVSPFMLLQWLIVALAYAKFCLKHYGLGTIFTVPQLWTHDQFQEFSLNFFWGSYNITALSNIIQCATHCFLDLHNNSVVDDGAIFVIITSDIVPLPLQLDQAPASYDEGTGPTLITLSSPLALRMGLHTLPL